MLRTCVSIRRTSFVEKVDSPIGDENCIKSLFAIFLPPVEKVDSPIGDENVSIVSCISFFVSRESRFPDRGRKFNSYVVQSHFRVEKVDSPIVDENFLRHINDLLFCFCRESRFPDRGRKFVPVHSPVSCFVVEKVDSPIGDENLLQCDLSRGRI